MRFNPGGILDVHSKDAGYNEPRQRGGGRGDQYVKIKIVIPPKVTAKEKDLFEKLAAESHFDPRELLGANRNA